MATGEKAPPSRFVWILLIAVLLGSVLRGVQLASLPDLGYFPKYTTAADAILDGDPPRERLGDLSPGYLWFVVALRATLGRSMAVLRAVQLVAFAGTVWVCALVALRLGGRLAGLVTAAALLCLRAPLVNVSEAEPETLFALTLALSILALSGRHQLGVARAGVGGVCVGLAIATRPTALAVAVPLLWPAGRSRRTAAAAAAGVALPVLAALGVNAHLGGEVVLMNPGTVFFEGMNPVATGYLGEAPRVVKELEGQLPGPDALHEAYRRVAAAARGQPVTPSEANQYWTARAVAFASTYPAAAVQLILRKGFLAVHSHEAWDLATMERKDRLLARSPWLPFAALLALAAVGVALRWQEGRVRSLALAALLALFVLVAFYVSSRQRSAALPPLAVLAGVGAAALLQSWRAGRRFQVLGIAAGAALVTVLLGRDGAAQREDRHAWDAALAAADARGQAARAENPLIRQGLLARADSWTPWHPPAAGAAALEAAVLDELTVTSQPARRFDLARAAALAGDCDTAERLLASLDAAGYRPVRGAYAVSSVAYYRARCALRRGRAAEAGALVSRALEDAPGDPWVLALGAALAPPAAAEALRLDLEWLHDPITAAVARARAAADTGNPTEARRELEAVRTALPELESRLPSLLE